MQQGFDRNVKAFIDYLFCAEQAVARVAETGKDVTVFIELFVEHGDEYFYVGVRGGELVYALWRGDNRHLSDILTAFVL